VNNPIFQYISQREILSRRLYDQPINGSINQQGEQR